MSHSRFEALCARLTLPVVQAPMFLISGPDMVIAAANAGILGSFPTQNARTSEQLKDWLDTIQQGCAGKPWAANVIVHPTFERRDADLELLLEYQPDLIVTALGSPKHIIERAHAAGSLVFADVISPVFARKAVDAGVDGLVLICSGAGGHTGPLSPFAFVDAVREFWDGPLILGGGIATGRGIRSARALGADLAYLGTRFLASRESMAADGYKQMVIDSSVDDIICSDAITGVAANWLRASLQAAGLDPNNMPKKAEMNVSASVDAKRWKDIWAAGQSVGPVHSLQSIQDIVDELTLQLAE
ncbi:nitronate monooxygenase [Litorivivens lipolytica]|uniref:Nitronate monooxygenase n=1 Tax=Litorivivens lipolytica TaxID=1524264 RepID=A0A7W4Z6J7_9GAMM|nr:nitronate monooxygenase [Litorivivens lipolytica]MBB3047015.1 nitronate monooxygenase [Litorivivens lipolytica]